MLSVPFAHFSLGNVGIRDRQQYSTESRNGTLLLLDVDSRKRYTRFTPRCLLIFPKLAGRIRSLRSGIRVKSITYSPTRKGWHIIIHVTEKLSPIEQIAIQAALGSDIKRELMNLQRYFGFKGKKIPEFWKDRWNLLFSRKLL